MKGFLAMVRVGAVEASAYRAEVVTFLLSTTLPLVMAAFFSALVAEGPLGEGGRFDRASVAPYFLATFVVRTLTGSFVSRRINAEIRDGTLASRLMRPAHPLLAYVAETVGALPLRLAVAGPCFAILLAADGGSLAPGLAPAVLFALALAGAFALSLLVSLAVGALAFFVEQSDKVMDAYLAGLFVLSGYLVPIALFPAWLRGALDLLPFRYQIGLPVEILVGAVTPARAARRVAAQWAFVALALAVALTLWRRGVRRFAAYGG